MTNHLRRDVCALLASVCVLGVAGAKGQGADPAMALVASAGQYIRAHEAQFTSMVGEEHQVQRLVKASGATAQQRDLVSEVIIVNAGGLPRVYRDVISVEGKPVHAREERLRKLFAGQSDTAAQQVQAIVIEGARFDLDFPRFKFLSGVVLPTVIVGGPTERYRFARTDGGVTVDEIESPTLFRAGRGAIARDMPLHGRLAIDATTGALRFASLVIGDADLEGTVDVRYTDEGAPGVFIPVQMRERYRHVTKPKDDHLEVVSDYSNFRRFEVAVQIQVGAPQ